MPCYLLRTEMSFVNNRLANLTLTNNSLKSTKLAVAANEAHASGRAISNLSAVVPKADDNGIDIYPLIRILLCYRQAPFV